jgi:hypothetical protein
MLCWHLPTAAAGSSASWRLLAMRAADQRCIS